MTNVIYRQPLNWVICAAPTSLEEECQDGDISYIVISDRYMDFMSLEEWIARFKELSPEAKLILLLSNYHEASINEKYVKMCKIKQVQFVLPGHGTAAIADRIRAWVDQTEHGKEHQTGSGKLITFVGSTPNVGTTVTSFGIAFRLALETNARIGYICLNLKSSKLHKYLGRDERVFTLDGLRAELKARSLSEKRLLQVCESMREAPRLHLLYGNMLREQAEFFTPSEIEHLLCIAKLTFDVCIVEVNAYWDNAATICGIVEADMRIAVTTGDMSHFQEDMNRWVGQVGSVFGVQSHAFDLIAVQIEKQSKSDSLSVKDIRKETQMHLIGQVSRYSDITAVLNRGKLSELLQSGHPAQEEISLITQKLIDFHRLPRIGSSRKIPWFKKMLAGTAAT
ncbi:hypothetical protein [Paenibacillus eucommiae]|uniref:Septum formation inhibitor-activating ATPase MinD n=1 Tax=Paenibacillus eucommiae TaxID=1355755 RepID=A0ABS4ITK7_9BACL|nr:hypothetical protein [Paenibacillus eucommiae]MBP1990907.1 septum formation inhibitor-activating ATPase MinD [Paenibacillus eucommiae]